MAPHAETAAPSDAQSERVAALKAAFEDHLRYTLGRDEARATEHDRLFALAMTVRDQLIERWIATTRTYEAAGAKRAYYLSMEYLMGRALSNNVIALDLERDLDAALTQLGLDREALADLESDAGLGNGGLGRLAACFLDSLATLELPGYGYGIRYDYGIFRQRIVDGHQVEVPDNWLRDGHPWEVERPDRQVTVGFGGRVEDQLTPGGRTVARWVDFDRVVGLPYDLPVAGFRNNTCNTLRLWTAKAIEGFDLAVFNTGQYMQAYERRLASENISKVLYPNDEIVQGRELRFRQQYFFVACSLHDILRRFKESGDDLRELPSKVAIQLNDTHPAIAIPELMRLLVDVEGKEWDAAWEVAVQVFGYTNHTLMPEALETWSVPLFERLLPRHLQIVYRINHHFLRLVRTRWPDDLDRVRRMSIIQEGAEKRVRMAYLSVVGSHKTNGVAALHSELLARHLLRDFAELWPERFTNKTNGITQRRWLRACNPGLSDLICSSIGQGWTTDLKQLRGLERHLDDTGFLDELRAVKRGNKQALAAHIRSTLGVEVDPDSLFDTQIKRLHEYKRQVLNVMHVLHRYFELKENPQRDYAPRTVIFSGKAAPGYAIAKLVIKLINDVAHVVNSDRDVNDKLRVIFLPDYRVSLAERIIPATDLSEQISTAGTEASGTGNMKFALNGAVTIGTLDGANVEICEQVGEENFFRFGLTVSDVEDLRASGEYDPWERYHGDPRVKRILDTLDSDFLNLGNPTLYRPLWRNLLLHGDHYLHLADLGSYLAVQEQVDEAYSDERRWARMCLANIARVGVFSADRSIQEYAEEIWQIKPHPVTLDGDTRAPRGRLAQGES